MCGVKMKAPVLILCMLAFVGPTFAEDGIKLVERKTCEQVKSEIANLSGLANPNAEQQAELKQLIAQQRANCGVKSGGRRTIPRAQPNVAEPAATPVAPAVMSDALTEYMNNKKSNCEKLNAEIEKLKADASKSDAVLEMQRVYNMDCVEQKAPDQAPVPEPAPTKTDEEWAAEFDANLAAGLCGDGTKPNRYGCCTGEVFKDLGDDGFACCPKNNDGLCFPPLK